MDTQWGGVLYLINLFTHLGLPDCFEDDWGLASRTGPWEALELVARGLLNRCEDPPAADPLWDVLAFLADRDPARPPGRELPPGAPFRVPAAWAAELPAPPQAARWAEREGWLRIWTDTGLTVAEVPAEAGSGRVRVDEELLRFHPTVPAPRPARWEESLAPAPPARVPEGARRWLSLVLPWISGRLRLALGLEPLGDIGGALLRLPATIFVTTSHVDVVMSLGLASLPTRLAGLDRNPGWLPDYGHVVTFHFM